MFCQLIIATYNFASGSSDNQKRVGKSFLFGKEVAVTQNIMLQSIISLIPSDQQVIFVGHDIQHDLWVLELLNFDFSSYNITGFDTQRVSAEIISRESFTLRRLLLALGCPFLKLHFGGNDANFILKALLLLAIRDCVQHSRVERRWATLKEIALNPLPDPIRPQTRTIKTTSFSCEASQNRAVKKKAKRYERSRKHQPKLWDNETQEKIRAEWAAKRLLARFSYGKDDGVEAVDL